MYEFDFDNDGVFEVGPQAGSSATHTCADNGSYLVNVRVTDGDGGHDIGSTTVAVHQVSGPTVVAIHAGPDQVNLNGAGVIPATLLGTAGFDVTILDRSTLRLAGGAAVHLAFNDVNGDGRLDLVLHFRRTDFVDEYAAALAADLQDGVLASNHQSVTLLLTGQTTGGADVIGNLLLDLFMSGKKLDQLLATI